MYYSSSHGWTPSSLCVVYKKKKKKKKTAKIFHRAPEFLRKSPAFVEFTCGGGWCVPVQ